MIVVLLADVVNSGFVTEKVIIIKNAALNANVLKAHLNIIWIGVSPAECVAL